VALHAVSQCDLRRTPMTCRASAVLGPPGRVFHVSEDAVYVWTAPWRTRQTRRDAAFVVRIPLDGGTPTGLRASGAPIDQLSFLQRDGWLNVVVASRSKGDAMWSSEAAPGAMALLRVPLAAFGDGGRAADARHYRPLHGANLMRQVVQNRFVGDWLLYGARGAEGSSAPLRALRYAQRGQPRPLAVGHAVERIDALGADGVAVGNDGNDLLISALRLGRQRAVVESVFRLPDAQQGETRTHGFSYRAGDARNGLLGLPVQRGDGARTGDASVLFLHNRGLRLSRAGDLHASRGERRDDACKASCVDWYGNARPIFLGQRLFALLGYELVEGELRDGRVHERRRVDFAPRGVAIAGASAP
jgi:hypothetical protein